MIRSIQKEDFGRLYTIWEKFYKNEFEFPDFLSNYLCAFSSVDSNGDIISTGGIRTIVEIVAMTDLDKSAFKRRRALYEILAASTFTAGKYGFNELHAFIIENKRWENCLQKVGFRPTRGNGLVLSL